MRRPIVWIAEISARQLGRKARRDAGGLLDDLQEGLSLGLPHSRPMPSIGKRCHELRVREPGHSWRIVYHLGYGEIVILTVFDKQSRETPKRQIELARRRLRLYQRTVGNPER